MAVIDRFYQEKRDNSLNLQYPWFLYMAIRFEHEYSCVYFELVDAQYCTYYVTILASTN